jgi:hypothetical protein
MQRPYIFLHNISVFGFYQINLPDEVKLYPDENKNTASYFSVILPYSSRIQSTSLPDSAIRYEDMVQSPSG